MTLSHDTVSQPSVRRRGLLAVALLVALATTGALGQDQDRIEFMVYDESAEPITGFAYHGTATHSYRDGQVAGEWKNATYTCWHPEGWKSIDVSWKDGIRLSVYDETGKRLYLFTSKGLEESQDDNGRKISELRDGVFRAWHTNGQLACRAKLCPDIWKAWQVEFPPLNETVDLEIVYVNLTPSKLAATFESGLSKLTEHILVTEPEMRARWRAHKRAYEWVAEETGWTQPLSFDVVRDQIRHEIEVGRVLSLIMDAAIGGGSLEGQAKHYHLRFETVEGIDRKGLANHPHFGNPRVAQMVFESLRCGQTKIGDVVEYVASSTGTFYPRVFDEPSRFLALFRVTEHSPSTR